MDQTEKNLDRRHILRLERFSTRTEAGPLWAKRIVPTPMFVSSDLAYGIQAADVCIYCINTSSTNTGRAGRLMLIQQVTACGRVPIPLYWVQICKRIQCRRRSGDTPDTDPESRPHNRRIGADCAKLQGASLGPALAGFSDGGSGSATLGSCRGARRGCTDAARLG